MNAILPLDVSHVRSHIPCESCGYKTSKYRVKFDPPGQARVEHRLCENCINAIKQ